MEDYKKKTIESYDYHAKEFSKKFCNLTDINRRYEFQKFINLLPGRDILDLGSGSGDHALYFLQKGLKVTCIDLSCEMIQLCIEKGLEKSFVMDIEDLTFKEDSFDGVWAVTSLVHIPKSEMKKVISSLYRILRRNGILYVCVKEGEGEKFVNDKFDGKTQRFFALWNDKEIINEFKNHFVFLESNKVKLGDKAYLQIFFRKP